MITSYENVTRRKRMVYVPVQSPHCHNTEVISAGKQANGAQRYQCQNEQCGRRWTDDEVFCFRGKQKLGLYRAAESYGQRMTGLPLPLCALSVVLVERDQS